jgi:hypothetical protein
VTWWPTTLRPCRASAAEAGRATRTATIDAGDAARMMRRRITGERSLTIVS